MTTRLSQAEARRMLLAAQGLEGTPAPATKADVLGAIRRMHALQIDTIHVVARSPYLVLWSRLGDYAPGWLDELLAEGAIFEYWAHAACFLPREDFPLYRRRILDGDRRWWLRTDAWFATNRELADTLVSQIRSNGPVRSSDFERPGGEKGGGWWSWKVEKAALEMLFTAGQLMIARRENFQRIYDVTERVRPDWDDSRAPATEDAYRALIARTVGALGVAKPEWIANYVQIPAAPARQRLRNMVAAGELVAVEVEGWASGGLVSPGTLEALDRPAGSPAPRTTLLSPFDPIVWDRRRALELFEFDYRIECYTPAPKRRYGYFTLPILHGDRLVGRLDPKAHRRDGVFEVKSIHVEPSVAVTDDLADGLRRALQGCASWHGTPEVVIRRTDPPGLSRLLSGSLSG
jgi:uncharacterized protein YcaQ